MKMSLETSILSTLAYHDIFDYPLTEEEIYKLLIQKKASAKSVSLKLTEMKNEGNVVEEKGFYHLKKRKELVNLRLKRRKISTLKEKKADFYAYLLKLIPTIKLVAITGALSMGNSTKNDDIDLLVVTQKDTMWTSRLLANIILLPFKRKPGSKEQKDKACLNIFIDESDLVIREQNLYTAHEIGQLKVLWDRNNSYKKLLFANSWINDFLANIDDKLKTRSTHGQKIELNIPKQFEFIAKTVQLKYMSKRRTTERIGETQLFFHPKDTQSEILKKYSKKVKAYS